MTYTKAEIHKWFQNGLAHKAVQPAELHEPELVIRGKFCTISMLGKHKYDLYVCNTKDMRKGLGARKLTNILSNFEEGRGIGPWTVLDGEAYATLEGEDIILSNLRTLGIRKRAQVSPATLALNTERLRKMHRDKAANK